MTKSKAIEEQFKNKVGDGEVTNLESIEMLLQKLKSINYENFQLHQGNNHEDFRFQLFSRIEMNSLNYYQSIFSILNNSHEELINKSLNLDYNKEFVVTSVLSLEQFLRKSYLESVFFHIDYFIQQINRQLSLHDSKTTHKKSQYFKMVLEKFNLEEEYILKYNLIDELNQLAMHNLNYEKTGKNSKIQFVQIYSYLTAIRNSFHNNSYGQRPLPNLDIGGNILTFEKNELIHFPCNSVIVLIIMILKPLEKVVEKTIELYPDQKWEDPYIKDLQERIQT